MTGPAGNPLLVSRTATQAGTNPAVQTGTVENSVPAEALLFAICAVNTAFTTVEPQSVTDSAGNTWTALPDLRTSSPSTRVYRTTTNRPMTTSDTVTTTWSTNANFRATLVVAVPSSSFDKGSNIVSGGATTAEAVLTGTPAYEGSAAIVLAATGSGGGQPVPDSPLQLIGSVQTNSTPYMSAFWARLPTGNPFTGRIAWGASAAAAQMFFATAEGAAAPLEVVNEFLPPATVGQNYVAALEARGGIPPYQWAASGLPSGLSITGDEIRGTPTAPGTAQVTLTVTDSA